MVLVRKDVDCVCVCACVFQALQALDKALQQPADLAVRAELFFSMGNQLREMNELDKAFEVLSTPGILSLFSKSHKTCPCSLSLMYLKFISSLFFHCFSFHLFLLITFG